MAVNLILVKESLRTISKLVWCCTSTSKSQQSSWSTFILKFHINMSVDHLLIPSSYGPSECTPS